MEVILRRSKITSTIMSQCTNIKVLETKDYEVLGWCVHKGLSWIVFYSLETKVLKKYLYFQKATIEEWPSGNYVVVLNRGDRKYNESLSTQTLEASENCLTLLNSFKELAIQRGQFYL